MAMKRALISFVLGSAVPHQRPPGSYSLTCGTVPVNLSLNPPFATLGDCMSTLKAQRCGGLKGQAKAACNHAQIGVCDATFNVPSAHNNG